MIKTCQAISSERGMTIIELVIGLVAFAIIVSATITAFLFSFELIGQSRARITATAIANEKAEIVRNITYTDVGTVDGTVPGILPQSEIEVRAGVTYTISTSVEYIDDPFDGNLEGTIPEKPIDTAPADYKQVRIQVGWDTYPGGDSPVVFITYISPSGLETATGQGALSIVVFDAVGGAVPTADVHLENLGVSPQVNLDTTTDANGRYQAVSIPPGAGYEIVVTKVGYTTEQTQDPIAYPDAYKQHATIVAGDLVTVGFEIDQLSTVNVVTQDNQVTPVPVGNIPLTLTGTKEISLGVPKHAPIDATTDGGGSASISDVEYDIYTLFVDGVTVGYDIESSVPSSPFNVSPGSTIELTITLQAHEDHTLLVVVRDGSGADIENASVRLYDGAGYDETKQTAVSGQAFFSPLEEKDYSIEITASGYEDYTDTVSISGQIEQLVNMNSL